MSENLGFAIKEIQTEQPIGDLKDKDLTKEKTAFSDGLLMDKSITSEIKKDVQQGTSQDAKKEKKPVTKKRIKYSRKEAIHVVFSHADLEGYKPQTPVGEVTEDEIEVKQTEDVKKAETLSKNTTERMQETLRNFLLSEDGVTDYQVSELVSNLINEATSEIQEDTLDETQQKNLLLLKQIGEATNADSIQKAFADAKKELNIDTVEKDEIDLDSSFFDEHPYYAKTVITYRLLKTMNLNDLMMDVEFLYNAISSSKEYQNEVREAKTRVLDKGATEYLSTLVDKSSLAAFSKEDREEVKKRILSQVPLLTDKARFELLTREDVKNIVALVSKRFRETNGIEAFVSGNEAYKDYLLDQIIAGKDFLSVDDFEKRAEDRKAKAEEAQNLFEKCSAYEEKPVRLRILKGDQALKAKKRIDHITGINDMMTQFFGNLNVKAPISFHVFRRGIADRSLPVSVFREKYFGYLDTVFKKAKTANSNKDKLTRPIKFFGKEYKTISSVGKLLKESYAEYGFKGSMGEVAETMGDGLYAKSDKDYYAKLLEVQNDIQIKSERNPVPTKEELEKIDKLNERIVMFKSLEKEAFSYMTDVLLANPTFREHIAADSDDEYKVFLAKITPACCELTKEIRTHIYVDQYLLEKKDDITRIVLTGQTENISQILELSKLDEKIEKTKLDGKTFKDRFREETGIGKKQRGEDQEIASLFFENVINRGASVIFDGAYNTAQRERVKANMAQLSAAYKNVLKELKDNEILKRYRTAQGALKVSGRKLSEKDINKNIYDRLLHDMRKEMFSMSEVEFKDSVNVMARQKVEGLLHKWEEQQTAARKADVSDLLESKRQGRLRYEEFVKQTDKAFRQLDPKQVTSGTSELDTHFILEEIAMEASEYMSDPFLESIFTAYMKKLIICVNNEDPNRMKNDIKILHFFKVFSKTADEVLSAKRDLLVEDKFKLKRGLFELYGNDIFDGNFTDEEAAAAYFRLELANTLNGDTRTLDYLKDDEGIKAGESFDAAKCETKQQKGLRKYYVRSILTTLEVKPAQFEEWGLGAGYRERIKDYTPEDMYLLAYLMQNSFSMSKINGIVEALTGAENALSFNVTDNATIMSYLKGEPLTGALAGLDYTRLIGNVEASQGFAIRLKDAMDMVHEYKHIREQKDKLAMFRTDEDVIDVASVISEMDKAAKAAYNYTKGLKIDKYLTNEDKLWRYYTVVRAYKDVFDRYQKCVDMGKISREDDEYLSVLPAVYARLQEYFSTEKHDKEATKKLYGIKLGSDLGIIREEVLYDKKNKDVRIDEELEKDKIRIDIQKTVRDYAYEKIGKERKIERRIVDNDEENFPPELVAAVREIDKWVAKHSRRTEGDSASDFAVEILGRSMRERLFIYYLIENEKEQLPTELDAAIAIQAYVPDLKTFKSKIKKGLTKVDPDQFGQEIIFSTIGGVASGIAHDTVSFIRKSEFIDNMGYLDGIGVMVSKKLETGIRLLENPDLSLGKYLDKMVQERKPYDDPDMPEEVKFRQMCYVSLMEEISRLRLVIKDKSEKELKDSPEYERQEKRVKQALRRVIKANDDVKKLAERGEKYGDDASRYDLNVWNFDGEKLNDLLTKPGIMDKLGSLFKIAAVLTSGKSMFEGGLNGWGRARNFFNTFEYFGVSVGRVSTYGSPIEEFIDGPGYVTNVAHFASGVATSIAGFSKSVISVRDMVTVRKAEEGALKIAKETKKETTKTEDQKTKSDEVEVQKTQIDEVKSVKAVIKIQEHLTKDELIYSLLRTVGGTAKAASSLALLPFQIPGIDLIPSAISGLVSVARTLFSFWYKSDMRQSICDEFLDINTLYKKIRPEVDKLDKKDWEKYGYYDDMIPGEFDMAIKDHLRMEVLKQLHYTNMEEFFIDVTEQYTKVIYRMIYFKKDGSPIMDTDTEEITKRQPLCDLFPGFEFKFPSKPGELPVPTLKQLFGNLTRTIK